jgi:hypothetical protein
MNNPKTMNKLVEAKFMSPKGNLIKVWNNSGQTGMWVEGHSKIYPVGIESFVSRMEQKYELIEMTRQVRERVLGNADFAYEITSFNNGKVVSHTN